MIDRTTVSAIAGKLGLSWHTLSTIAMRAVADLIAAAGPDRLAGVRVIGATSTAGPHAGAAPRGSLR